MRRALTISLVTMVPAWCLRVVVSHRLLLQPLHRSPRNLLPLVTDDAFLVLCVVVAAVVVLVMSRFGLGRSEFWWLAGGAFVAATAATSLVTEVPAAGDFVLLDLVFSMLTGYWIAVFVAGALAWRHWTPTYPPRSWTPLPEVDYDW